MKGIVPTLFGIKLSDKIKASQAIERQGLKIKKSSVPQKSPLAVHSAVPRPRYQENWPGLSRYLSNRGGRAWRPEETSPCSMQGSASGSVQVSEHEQNACSTSIIEQVHSGRIHYTYVIINSLPTHNFQLNRSRRDF